MAIQHPSVDINLVVQGRLTEVWENWFRSMQGIETNATIDQTGNEIAIAIGENVICNEDEVICHNDEVVFI